MTSSRYYETPVNGNSFAPGSLIKFNLGSSPCLFLNTSETMLVFTISNGLTTSTPSLTLDNGGGAALIDGMDLYMGSNHISSIPSSYANLFSLFQDNQSGLDDVRSGGTVRGMADFDCGGATGYASGSQAYTNSGGSTVTTYNATIPSTYTSAAAVGGAVTAAYYNNLGVTIASATTWTVGIPLLSILGTFAMKALPLGMLQDDLRLEIRLQASALDYGVYSASPTTAELPLVLVQNPKLFVTGITLDAEVNRAMLASLPNQIAQIPTYDIRAFSTSVAANANFISYTIPLRCTSMTALWVTLRETACSNSYQHRALARVRAGAVNYRFRIGSLILPQSAVICSGSAAEARIEVLRSFGQISDAAPNSSLSNGIYTRDTISNTNLSTGTAVSVFGEYGGFCIGLNTAALSAAAESISDGRSTRNQHVTIEITLGQYSLPMRMDVYAQLEMLLNVQNGVMSFSD